MNRIQILETILAMLITIDVTLHVLWLLLTPNISLWNIYSWKLDPDLFGAIYWSLGLTIFGIILYGRYKEGVNK